MSVLTQRRNCLPVIYVRGSHYDVGFDIGRTFSNLIQDYLRIFKPLNEVYIPLYLTEKGREVYEEVLEAVNNVYPQYVKELQGTADGANVPFFKLFLLHLDDILPGVLNQTNTNLGQGCSTLCVNQPNEKLLGHTEDAFKEVICHNYIVKATITDVVPHEEFTAFCYAGLLPGYAMGFNECLSFSVNIIGAKYPSKRAIPRTFLTRALFTARTLQDVEEIMKCPGYGIGDALSLNLIFFGQGSEDSLFYNIEAGPKYPAEKESAISTVLVKQGEHLFHCNRFLRLDIPEDNGPLVASSVTRHATKDHLPEPVNKDGLLAIIGDHSKESYNIFRNEQHEAVFTIAVGVFNVRAKTWSLYMDNPKTSKPLVVLPLGGNNSI